MTKLDLKRAQHRRRAKGPHCVTCGLMIYKPKKVMSLGVVTELLHGQPSPLAASVDQALVYNRGMRRLSFDLAAAVRNGLHGRRRP